MEEVEKMLAESFGSRCETGRGSKDVYAWGVTGIEIAWCKTGPWLSFESEAGLTSHVKEATQYYLLS